MLSPDMSYLTDIYFGYGRLGVLPEVLAGLRVRRPLVVTDRDLVGLGLVKRLGLARPAVFDRVETNPTERLARAGAAAYRKAGCDGIIALGGGSPIDLAKIVALLAVHDPPLVQYAALRGGTAKITRKLPLVVAIPTTAGSGSEVGRAALVTLSGGIKLGFISPRLLPAAAICDPSLTLSMPPALTAGTGMDAISHCLEAYLSNRINPVADALCLDGLSRAWASLRPAVADGANRIARADMLLASMMAGLAFQKSLGAVHSLSHPLGGLTAKKLHHGTLNAIFLPHVLRFNHRAAPEKYEILAKIVGVDGGEMVAYAVEALISELKLPVRLRELGVSREELPPLARKAFEDHCTPTNPRPLSVEACAELYERAW